MIGSLPGGHGGAHIPNHLKKVASSKAWRLQPVDLVVLDLKRVEDRREDAIELDVHHRANHLRTEPSEQRQALGSATKMRLPLSQPARQRREGSCGAAEPTSHLGDLAGGQSSCFCIRKAPPSKCSGSLAARANKRSNHRYGAASLA